MTRQQVTIENKEDDGGLITYFFFEAPNMLLNHHQEFLMSVRKKKFSLGSVLKNETTSLLAKDLYLNHIDIGNQFSVVSGVFSDHAFLDYLYQQSTIEYVEPNQIYKAAVMPSKRLTEEDEEEERIQRADMDSLKTSKPANWGLARINHRQRGNFDGYIFDSVGGYRRDREMRERSELTMIKYGY